MISDGGGRRTLSAASWTLGFLFPMRFFNDLAAAIGCTVFERMVSEISRFVAISSREDEVARSICSSSAVFEDENHLQAQLVANPAFVSWASYPAMAAELLPGGRWRDSSLGGRGCYSSVMGRGISCQIIGG